MKKTFAITLILALLLALFAIPLSADGHERWGRRGRPRCQPARL